MSEHNNKPAIEIVERERDEALRRAEQAEAELQRFRDERTYVVGWNDGYAAAQRGFDPALVEAWDI